MSSVLRKGDRGVHVRQLQGALNCLGFDAGAVDGAFGKGTESAVEKFQESRGLRDDGVAGARTLDALNTRLKDLGKLQWYVELPSEGDRSHHDTTRMKWVSTLNDKWVDEKGKKQGLKRTTLREDCAVAYRALMADVHALGGILTTAGGKRPLKMRTGDPEKDRIGSAQSSKSLHYVGLAFDLALPTGGSRITQPYLLVRDPKHSRKWVVWCQSPMASEVELTVDIIKGWKKTSISTKKITVRAFNFTELAKKHGFVGITGRRSFFRGGGFTSSEWWHFQYAEALTPGVSTFGDALLKLYPLSKCKRFLFWEKAKNAVWKRSWF